MLPVDELVQAARRANDFQTGPDREMVGIAENDLRLHLAQFSWVERLDAPLRADGHEDRSINDTMSRG